MELLGQNIFLRTLTTDDVSQAYVDWMNDEEVTQFLESKGKTFTLDEIKKYVQKMEDSPGDYIFGIFSNNTKEHIGNIKIGNVDPVHQFADIGLLIGKKDLHGKGYGTEAISLVTRYAFEQLKLNKLFAGTYANNVGSYKCFLNAGYREAGRLTRHRFYKGAFVDQIIIEKCNEEKLS